MASAVIAAFFLMGGVASADEVISPTVSDTPALTTTSPTETSANSEEVSANNAVAENAVANTATETPAVASGDTVSANSEVFANANDVVFAINSEAATNESSSNKTISATLTVPADRTVTASSATDDARILDKSKEQVINVNVSGEGSLPVKSRIEIEVTTDIERGQEKVLNNDLKASSSTKLIDNNNGKVYKSVIDISGFKAGLQKEMIVSPNSVMGSEVTIKPMHRFITYNLFVGDELVSTQKVTETFIPASPVLKLKPIENRLTVERKSDGQVVESFVKANRDLNVASRNWNSVYKFELEDKSARLVDSTGRIDYERFRDDATNSYLINYSVLRQNFSSNNNLPIAVDTYATAKSAYRESNETRFVDTNLSVTMYYSDEAISDTTDLSSLKSVKTDVPIRTIIEEKISNKGVLQASLELSRNQDGVLGTINHNVVVARIAPPKDDKLYDDTNLPESILKLNLDDKKLKPSKLDIGFYNTLGSAPLTDIYKIEVSDADTGVKIGVVSVNPYNNDGSGSLVGYGTISLPENVKALKFTPLTPVGVGRNLSSNIRVVDYSVLFASDINDALSWKSELDHSNVKEDHTRYELQLLNDDGSVAAQTNTTLTILNKSVVAKLYNNGQSIFVPSDNVRGTLEIPFELVNVDYQLLGKLYDVTVDESALRAAFKQGDNISRNVVRFGYVDATGSLRKTLNPEYDSATVDRDAIRYSGYLEPGNHVYQIPITLKPKYDVVKTADANNVLKDGEVKAVYTLVTYSEYTSIAESLFRTTDSSGDKVYVKNKDLTAVTTVGNLTQSDMPRLEAMAYIPKSDLEGSTANTTLAEKVKPVDGWDILYTTDSISGSYKTDRNLNYSSEVDDYSKVTAVKFVSNRAVKKGDIVSFDVKLNYSKDLGVQDSIRYRSVLLTDNDEVLSTPVVARETKPLPTTVKELFRPDLTDSLTKRLYEELVSEGALFRKADSLGGAQLFDESSTTISNFESSTIKSLEARNLKRRGVNIDLSDQIGIFNHYQTEHRNSSDLEPQFTNYDANKDLTVTNTGEQGSNATIVHYYRATRGNIVERFVDESGIEIKTPVNSGEEIAKYEYASYSHPATIETDRATYEYAYTEGVPPYIVPEGTTTVTYVYRKVADKITYGSVIATYKDTEGNELASQENVKTDAPDGEAYTTVAKTIPSSEVVEKTLEGMIKRTITSYKLIEMPANAEGNVIGNSVITVPYVYRKTIEETLVPGDTPTVEIPELKVTRYQTEDGTDIKDSSEGFVDAPNTIDKYQFTGTTNMNEGNDVQTHIYKLIETEIPDDVPQVDIPVLKVTRYVNEEGTEIKDSEEGLVPAPSLIGENYQFTGRTETTEDGSVQTHIYKVVEHEVPGDAPSVEIPELKVTRYQTEDGIDIQDSSEGFVNAPKTIGDYQFTGVTNMNEGNDVQTHIYKRIQMEIPGDAPIVDIPELRLTRHVDEKGKELLPIEKGSNGPRKTIGDYEYTGRTDVDGGVTTHVYAPIRYELPGDAPQYDIPELVITRHIDEKGKELIEIEKGKQPPRKTIGENEYTGRTTEKDGITTHVYKPIKYEVPGDAPIVDVPELKVTRYVNEKGEEIKESEAGFINAPKTIGEYEFTGKTELNEGKDVQTHIYKLVEKPVTPTPDPKKPETPSPRTPEPKKPETPQPEAPKPIETPKSNDSKPVVAESVDQPQFVKDELPKTGETNSNLALVGVSLLTALGLVGFVKRKREE